MVGPLAAPQRFQSFSGRYDLKGAAVLAKRLDVESSRHMTLDQLREASAKQHLELAAVYKVPCMAMQNV